MARTTPVHAGFTIVNGNGTGINGNRIDVWAEYKLGTQNPSGNYTPITVYFYAALRSGYQSSTALDRGLDSALKVDGKAGIGVQNGAYSFESVNNINALGSFTGNISHNAIGTKTVSIQGSFTTESSYISGGSVSASLVLPAIPRASTLGATDADIGKTSVIAVSVKSAGYTHSIHYSFGNLSGYITADGKTSATQVKLSATSIPFTVPDSFYAQIPNSKTGICTLTCRTYSGNTQIGTDQTASFTLTAPEDICKPFISGHEEDVNPVTLALTGDKTVLIKDFSTAHCTMEVQPQKSASIVQTRIGDTLTTSDSLDIAFTQQIPVFYAKDSRGYETHFTPQASLLAYTALTNNASVSRDDPTSGHATVLLQGSYYAGSFGAADNTISVSYSLNGSQPISVQPQLHFENGMYVGSFSISGLDYTSEHSLQLTVSDRLGSVTKVLSVHKGVPVFDWGETDFVFHVPVQIPQLSCPQLDAILQRLDALESK